MWLCAVYLPAGIKPQQTLILQTQKASSKSWNTCRKLPGSSCIQEIRQLKSWRNRLCMKADIREHWAMRSRAPHATVWGQAESLSGTVPWVCSWDNSICHELTWCFVRGLSTFCTEHSLYHAYKGWRNIEAKWKDWKRLLKFSLSLLSHFASNPSSSE